MMFFLVVTATKESNDYPVKNLIGRVKILDFLFQINK